MALATSTWQSLCLTVLVLTIVAVETAVGEIVYTPSTKVFFPSPIPSEQTGIDFNGDTSPEFRIFTQYYTICACLPGDPPPPFWVLTLDDEAGGSNQMHVVDAPGQSSPVSLSANTLIDGTQPFVATNNESLLSVSLVSGGVRGSFLPSSSPQFVGVKFQIDGDPYFGWIGFHVSPIVFPGVQLFGYAYENEGNSIRAGQTVLESNLPGDFDGDGVVNGRDFLAWQRGDSPDPLSAGDLAAWQSNYSAPGIAAFAVPEPFGIHLLAIGAFGMLGRQR